MAAELGSFRHNYCNVCFKIIAMTLKTASLETTGPFIRAVFEVSASVEFRMMLECDRLH